MKKALALYIHIPFCISKCDYCDFFSKTTDCFNHSRTIPDEYVDSLCNEISFRLKTNNSKVLNSIYIGGGTPSLLLPSQIKKISDAILENVSFARDYEFTFEVNPDDVTKLLLDSLESVGVNRISCGIQSFSDKVLKFVNRRAGEKQVENAFELMNDYWKKSLSLDLICGLPYETKDSLMKGLEKCINSKADHVSFYSLCVEEETSLYNKIQHIDYDFDLTDELWIEGRDFLIKNGFSQYEISNFCKNNKYSKHNMVYWKHEGYIGCGAGGTGTLYDNEGKGNRWTNTKDINKYIDFWDKACDFTNANIKASIPQVLEEVNKNTSIFEYFMMGLRTKNGVSVPDYENIFNQKFPSKVIEILKKWNKKGMCVIENEVHFYLNEKGMLFLNALLEEILEILD